MHSKALRHVLKMKPEKPLKPSILIIVENTAQKSLKFFCDAHGIQRELIVAYSPQQNGILERKNKTILNMVRSLLARRRISKSFWSEAVNWSI